MTNNLTNNMKQYITSITEFINESKYSKRSDKVLLETAIRDIIPSYVDDLDAFAIPSFSKEFDHTVYGLKMNLKSGKVEEYLVDRAFLYNKPSDEVNKSDAAVKKEAEKYLLGTGKSKIENIKVTKGIWGYGEVTVSVIHGEATRVDDVIDFGTVVMLVEHENMDKKKSSR